MPIEWHIGGASNTFEPNVFLPGCLEDITVYITRRDIPLNGLLRMHCFIRSGWKEVQLLGPLHDTDRHKTLQFSLVLLQP